MSENGQTPGKPALLRIIDTITKGLITFENVSVVALFVVMTAVSFLQVIFRYVTKTSAPWTEELGRYSMIFLVMIGAGWSVYANNHIKIDVIDALIKNKRVLLAIKIVTGLMTLVFCCFFAYGALILIPQVMRSNLFSVSLNIPMWIPQIAIFIGGALLSIHYLFWCIQLIYEFVRPEKGEGAAQ